ncbi:MAG: hypothetical protein M5U07_05865 [Xanthobacteraceae bacterium]|nr:hypothetical protein [Xanthobacteraceae bacterium]PWB63757.1 MAG: hypothetical protein C3F17_08825 [Bradyrhizobiaceae bacterium]
MTAKPIAAALLLAALAMPALAQEAFYIVRDSTTKKCSVVAEKPSAGTLTIVGSGTAYKTREQAQEAMQSVRVCVEE